MIRLGHFVMVIELTMSVFVSGEFDKYRICRPTCMFAVLMLSVNQTEHQTAAQQARRLTKPQNSKS